MQILIDILIHPIGATMGVLFTFITAPLAVASAVLIWMRLRKAPDEKKLIEALDRVLEEDSKTLRRSKEGHPLKFRTSDQVRLDGVGIGWGFRPGRVDIVRTIRAATKGGYRLRLRAFVRGAHGRTIVRSVEVDVRRRR